MLIKNALIVTMDKDKRLIKNGDIGYDDRADMNGDCSVSLADLVILSKQYGKSC